MTQKPLCNVQRSKEINPSPELEPLFKTLRLSGMLDSLSARNQEAIKNKLAYTEFMALMLQDEIIRRDQKKFDSRFRKSRVKGDKRAKSADLEG